MTKQAETLQNDCNINEKMIIDLLPLNVFVETLKILPVVTV